MGQTPSVDLNIHTQMNPNYFAVQMGHQDRFRLILAPEEIFQATQAVLANTWHVQDLKRTNGFSEFKLDGNPWYSTGEDNLKVKYFMCSLLQRYYMIGWHLKAASDMQRSGSDTNVLFFHKEQPCPDTSVICLSLNSSDKIRILAPENIQTLIKNSVEATWPLGIQREKMLGLSLELKLKGTPWNAWSNDSIEGFSIPLMMCEIMSNLYKAGWIFSGAIDTGKTQYSLNALYFKYAPGEIKKEDLDNTSFFALSLNKSDRVRLHRSTNDLEQIMTNPNWGMPQLWPRGIQETTTIHNALDFKLKGNPWLSNESEAVDSRRLLSNIFNLLSRYGWSLYATCDLTKNLSNKSTFFFRSKPIEPKTLVNFCVSLNESDRIRLIEHNNNEALIDQARQAILQGWPKGIQKDSDYFNSWQFKLVGWPFSSFDSSSDNVYATVMMLYILSNIEKMGYRLLCSADVSGKYVSNKNESHAVDLHSWFF